VTLARFLSESRRSRCDTALIPTLIVRVYLSKGRGGKPLHSRQYIHYCLEVGEALLVD
jgi:hypothetical protein